MKKFGPDIRLTGAVCCLVILITAENAVFVGSMIRVEGGVIP